MVLFHLGLVTLAFGPLFYYLAIISAVAIDGLWRSLKTLFRLLIDVTNTARAKHRLPKTDAIHTDAQAISPCIDVPVISDAEWLVCLNQHAFAKMKARIATLPGFALGFLVLWINEDFPPIGTVFMKLLPGSLVLGSPVAYGLYRLVKKRSQTLSARASYFLFSASTDNPKFESWSNTDQGLTCRANDESLTIDIRCGARGFEIEIHPIPLPFDSWSVHRDGLEYEERDFDIGDPVFDRAVLLTPRRDSDDSDGPKALICPFMTQDIQTLLLSLHLDKVPLQSHALTTSIGYTRTDAMSTLSRIIKNGFALNEHLQLVAAKSPAHRFKDTMYSVHDAKQIAAIEECAQHASEDDKNRLLTDWVMNGTGPSRRNALNHLDVRQALKYVPDLVNNENESAAFRAYAFHLWLNHEPPQATDYFIARAMACASNQVCTI